MTCIELIKDNYLLNIYLNFKSEYINNVPDIFHTHTNVL
ncbi:hypothetical protein GGR21_001360 [Dysgonomonas hofstadii]|uniref:Uncharacterized protein n=1 Tax=Dysgonomonas hofstadii TaxID=637886 RepID=A0A840CHI1_9BACT|nr:hypothetical protein [Dysgonomonas hofstadii]